MGAVAEDQRSLTGYFVMTVNWRWHVVAAFACGLIVGPLFYLVIDREVPFVIYHGRIVPPEPRPGDVVEIEWTGNRVRACPGMISRRIVDSIGIIHTIAGVDAQYTQTANPQPVVRNFRLPLALAPGPATYYATSSFICNFTQKWWPIVVERPPVQFNVLPLGEHR